MHMEFYLIMDQVYNQVFIWAKEKLDKKGQLNLNIYGNNESYQTKSAFKIYSCQNQSYQKLRIMPEIV